MLHHHPSACSSQKQLSLPLLASYLDLDPLPEKLGKLTLTDLVAHKSIMRDDDHPGYYFSAASDSTIGMKGVKFHTRVFGEAFIESGVSLRNLSVSL